MCVCVFRKRKKQEEKVFCVRSKKKDGDEELSLKDNENKRTKRVYKQY
jgi:hypothetical protein